MTQIPSMQGLWHLALRVRNLGTAKQFYSDFFGMRVVWEPDAQNCYMSSGGDNLALHEDAHLNQSNHHALDHFGFVVESPAVVDAWAERARQSKVPIVTPPKEHRDGSYSFYLTDPDGNSIQVLYEPTISRIKKST